MLAAVLPWAIPLAIRVAERAIGNGKGSEKKLMVLGMVKAIVERFQAPGVGLPGDGELDSLIEADVAQMNKAKQLVGEATAIVPSIDLELADMARQNFALGFQLLQRAGVTP